VNRLSVFLSSIILMMFFIVPQTYSQVPVINPGQTVNPATGEMGFSLPLSTVKGINGHDYTIQLNYAAGIRTNQQASPVGLGFSYGAGSITRKVIFVPDDNPGSSTLDFIPGSHPVCIEGFWRMIWGLIALVISIVITIATHGAGVPFVIATIANLAVAGALNVVQLVVFGVPDFSAGGTHLPSYNFKNEDKKGFLKGGNADLPDIYIVNSPYINGQMVWVGNAATGHFVMKQVSGSLLKDASTVQINYENEIFTILTPDGTKLIFDKSDKYGNTHYSDWAKSDNDEECIVSYTMKQTGALPVQWHLTKVLFNDYVDGNGDSDPLNSETINYGSWICFGYDEKINTSIYQEINKEAGILEGAYSRQWNAIGKYDNGYEGVTLYNLNNIKTPNQTAVFEYINDRKDNVWLYTGTNIVVNGPVLNRIKVKAKNGTVIKAIDFSTAYELRPHTESAFISSGNPVPGNPDAASLTLKSVIIRGEDGTGLPAIRFEYGYNPSALPYKTTNPANGHLVAAERRDAWEYYNPNTPNDWNANGEYSRAVSGGGQVYAAAWSMRKLLLPSGMTIEWTYEPNRYLFANNVAMTDVGGNPQVKYGDGIRVKQIDVNDGLGNNKITSLFYTQMQTVGSFEETSTNSSGHATALPYPYILEESQDKRPNKAKGGLYTPAKVAYEKTIIADNYDWVNHSARNGFTVYEFYTSKDFQNSGDYGEVDYSWKRGMVNSVTNYGKNNQLVSKTINKYEFSDLGNTLIFGADESGEMYTARNSNSTGIVRLISTSTKKNKVKTDEQYFYGDILGNGDPVQTTLHRQSRFRTSAVGGSGYSFLTEEFGHNQSDIVSLSIRNTNADQLSIDVLKNVDFHGFYPSWQARGDHDLQLPGTSYKILAAELAQMDGNVAPDLIVVLKEGGYHSLCYGILYNLNFSLNGDFSHGDWVLVRWNPFNDPFYCKYNVVYSMDKINTAALCDLNNNGKPDILFYNSENCKLFLMTDIDPSLHPCKPEIPGYTDIYSSSRSYSFPEKIRFTENVLEAVPDHRKNNLIFPQITSSIEVKCLIMDNLVFNGNDIYFDPPLQAEQNTPVSHDYNLCGTIFLNSALNLHFIDCNFGKQIYNIAALWVVTVLNETINVDYNGQPKQIIETNSDGNMRITIPRPAYLDNTYNAMKAKHMLTQLCQTTVYNVPTDRAVPINPASLKKNVVSSQATTWSNYIGTDNTVWLPYTKYVWNVKMDATSRDLPDQAIDFADFVHSSTTNPHWKFMGSVDRYNCSAQPLQSTDALGMTSSTIYCNDVGLPVAGITNGKYSECLFSNFSVNGLPADDQSGCATLITTLPHFSPKTLQLSTGTPGTTDRWARTPLTESSPTLAGKEIRWEFWAKAESPEMELQTNPPRQWIKFVDFEVGTKWTKYSFRTIIPSGITRYRVSIRPPFNTQSGSFTPGTIYYDDIRAYPSNAFMTTTYYDDILKQPVLSVDASNNASSKVTYDEFGRPVKWEKFDKVNHDYLITLKTLRYQHYQNQVEPDLTLIKPNGGEKLVPGQQFLITWSGPSTVGTNGVDLSYFNGSSWTAISNGSQLTGTNSCLWTVPPKVTGCLIKVQSFDDPSVVDQSDGTFIINTPPPLPGNWNFTRESANSVRFSWTPVIDPDGDNVTYRVYVGPSSGGPFTELSNTSDCVAHCWDSWCSGTGHYWYVIADDGISRSPIDPTQYRNY
jgi:hypothetical protein